MAKKTWQTLKICYCERADAEVSLEAEVVYPVEFLPDQAPRILAHRCSLGAECNKSSKVACIWAGTNPNYDPFQG
ncbi:MAG TPA: hypothetical protein VMT46_18285 [Anaerolineaceae bacterium]|nr:hypothetical protein [Anaerolineaceae bacterium]